MEKGSYLKWLYHCLVDVQCSLLSSLERKDYVQFIEASHVRNEYMNRIGDYEQEVLKEELEVAILEKKKQRIQVAINRNESLDLAKLEEELNQEREVLLQQVNAQYDTQFETADLPSEALEELKELYKKIVEQFHPEVHNLTDNQKALFDKAVDCYRMRKLEELKIVYEMLKSTEDMQEFSLDLNLTLSIGDGTTDQQVLEYVNEIGTNYSKANYNEFDEEYFFEYENGMSVSISLI